MKEVIRDIWPAAAFLIGLWLITRGIVLLQERDDANLLGFLMVGVPCAYLGYAIGKIQGTTETTERWRAERQQRIAEDEDKRADVDS